MTIAREHYSLNEWLHYFEHRPQQEIQLGLSRIKTVAQQLNLLPLKSVVITVAGTNGKGSTVAMLEAIYSEAGYRVGAYTSPHLLFFNERIRLNQEPITDNYLCDAFTLIERARGSIHLTYFEMATLAALLAFKQSQLDLIILEVGLGGRLDATNIVDADLSIITTIDFDHKEYLGDTIEAIGFEKAGILRQNQMGIYADVNIPNSIVRRAQDLNVHMMCLNQDYFYELDDYQLNVSFTSGEIICLPRPRLHPNATVAGVVASQRLMDKLPVTADSLVKSMQIVHISGRQQIIYDTMCTVLDVSHNPQAVQLLATRVQALMSDRPTGKVYAVFSGLKDKDLYGLIHPMLSLVDDWYSAVLDSHRAASTLMLINAFDQAGKITPRLYDSIAEAYQAARLRTEPSDIIVVYGSFLVVSAVMLKEGWR